LQTFEPAWKIPFPSVPLTMVIERGRDGSSSRIFAEVKNFNGFVVADFKSGKELQKIEFADPIKYRFGALKNTSGGKNVTATEYNPTHGTDISPDGKILWVTSRGTNYLYAYSLPDLKLIAHIFLPSRQRPGGGELETGDPHWLVPSPDGKSLYVGLAHFNSLIVIDTKSMKVVDEIPVGKAPKMIDAYAIP
ncbi:MAG: YncE family protein, partial [Terriglobales bacterium]